MNKPSDVRASAPTEADSQAARDLDTQTQSPVANAPPKPPVPFAPPTVAGEIGRLGKYRIQKELGHGGMGAVYLAFDEKLQRPVALKVMLEGMSDETLAKDRFLREARAAAQIQSDHVVAIHETDEIDGIPYIALQFLQGSPLDEYLKRHRQLPIAEILRIGYEAALGLAAAHELHLVHRDIKPSNLWLEAPNNRVKILDFGLAKPIGHREDAELSKPGSVLGTPAYMSPEQGMGQPVDGRTDLFSLGCVLYRLCTGNVPFARPTLMALLHAIAHDEPAPIHEQNPEVPTALVDLIQRMMAKQPADRPASAREVAQELQAIDPSAGLNDLATLTYSSASKPTRQQPRRSLRTTMLAVLLAGCAIVLGGVIIIKITNKDGTKSEITVEGNAKVKIKDGTVEIEPQEAPVATADRKLAEYILSLGGLVRINNQVDDINLAADLPKGPFQLTGIVLANNTRVTDAGLESAKNCPHITHLNLQNSKITDACLQYFKKCDKITYLVLNDTPVSDRGLANFNNCTAIEYLSLAKTRLTDAGLESFKNCTKIKYLYLWRTQVTDVGLSYFANLPELSSLWIFNTRSSDRGMENFRNCNKLKEIYLNSTDITDQGLVNFKNAKQLTYISLANTKITDRGLENFQGCQMVDSLYLYNTRVTSKGLNNFKDSKNVILLDITNSFVDDEGLSNFVGCTKLQNFQAGRALITDLGLAYLKNCKNLRVVNVANTAVANEGLAHLANCTQLTNLYIWNLNISDAGLVYFKNCKQLTELWLNGTQITSEGLTNFEGCVHLQDVNLSNTSIDDKGAAMFAQCPKLKTLNLAQTNVSFEQFTKLRKALPQCRIDWSSVISPQEATANRKAAEYVLSIGGLVQTSLAPEYLKDVTSLPKGRFVLTGINMRQNKALNDAGLAIFKDCKHLKQIDLWQTNVSDTGLANFKDCKKLTSLQLQGTRVTDAGLEHFRGCNDLTFLVLGDAPSTVTEKGVAIFKNCTQLTTFSLHNIKITDQALADFGRCTKLQSLWLRGTLVTDQGLAHFKNCKDLIDLNLENNTIGNNGLDHFKDHENLTQLNIRMTQVTAAKIKELQMKWPQCQILNDHEGHQP